MVFADAINSDTPVVVGAFVTVIGAFLAVAKVMLGQATTDREADRKERIKLSEAISLMAENSSKVAEATQQSAVEAKERNGHLGDQNVKIVELITSQNTALSELRETSWMNAKANKKTVDILSKSALIAAEDRDVLTTLAPQIIKEQNVAHQTINKVD